MISFIEMRERLLERHQGELAALDRVVELAAGLEAVDVSAYPLGSPYWPASTPDRLAQLAKGPVMPAPVKTKKGKRKYKQRKTTLTPALSRPTGEDEGPSAVARLAAYLRPDASAPAGKSVGGGTVVSKSGAKGIKLTEAIRTLGREMGKGATFTRESLADQILKRWPSLKEKLIGMGVSLVDMVARGELRRSGAARSAIFTVVKMKEAKGAHPLSEPEAQRRVAALSPGDKEKKWKEMRGQIDQEIKVPRDAEAGDDAP